jgi:hypothetical protein
MAKTLLDGVNEILRKKNLIAGDAALLTSLTDSSRQPWIDVAVQVINEGIDEIYSISQRSLPNQMVEATITLLTNTKAYALPAGLVRLHWPLIDRTNRRFIQQYATGYEGMLLVDLGQVFTGLPLFAAIRASDNYLVFDRTPTSAENGNVYNYQYDKDTVLAAASDTMPFNNAVFRAMVPVWTQMWEREKRTQDYDVVMLKTSLGRAARLLTENQPRETYNPRQGVGYYLNSTDPMPE